MEILKKAKWLYIVLSVIYIALGIVLLIYPSESIDVICRIIGATALVFGFYGIIRFFFRTVTTFYSVFMLITGIFSFICGIILLVKPDFIKTFFPVVIGVIVVVDSAFKLMTSFELRNTNSKLWWSVFFLSLAGIILGFALVFNSKDTIDLLARLIGACLIVDGIENFFAVFSSVRALKKIAKAAPVEVTYKEIKTEPENNSTGNNSEEK